MSLAVSAAYKVTILQSLLNQTLTLKLYSNNVTPTSDNVAADFTEVVGGGYAAKTLEYVTWTILTGIASYNTIQTWTFSGATNAPGTIYGYFIVDGSGILVWAERFPGAQIPYTPSTTLPISFYPRIVLF